MANSIFPNQIPPESVALVGKDMKISHNWWLFFYNVSQAILGNTNNSAAAYAAQVNADLDADVDVTDSIGLLQRVTNLELRAQDDTVAPNVPVTFSDDALVDPIPVPQPVQAITVGASPFTYIARFQGTVIVNGGTVSNVALSRDGVNFYAVSGAVPVRRLDQVQVTYSVAPTMVLFPG